MSVYNARYRRIEEPIKKQSFLREAITMSKFEVRRALTGGWAKVPLIFGGFILFGFLISLSTILGSGNDEFWNFGNPEDPFRFSIRYNSSTLLAPMDGPGSLILFQIAIVSSGLIAGDLKDRALDLYLSKINIREYFVAKLSASCMLTFIGMPLFTIIYFIVSFYKRWPSLNEYSIAGFVLLRILLFMTIEVIFLSILILFFSALSKNSINAGVIFLVFILSSRVFFQTILWQATDLDIFYTLSPSNALNIIRRRILGPEEIAGPGFIEITQEVFLYSIISCILYASIALVSIYFILRRESRR